jgi:predicted MFS family arabinose efflux permease
MAGTVTGNLLGASTAGVVGEFLGWRGVLVSLGVIVIVAAISAGVGFRRAALVRASSRMDFAMLLHGYRTVFRNPNAAVCYSAVFVEGCCILGLFPFIASFLYEMGQTSPSIAGLVIAAFAVGGLIYTVTVSRILPRFGVKRLMIFGGVMVASQLLFTGFGPSWQMQTASFLLMGLGFYSLHGCLQVFASELSVEVRATAMALHSFFFFMGQTLGPIAYGQGISQFGKLPTLSAAAAAMFVIGFVCAKLLRPSRPTDAV